MPMPGGPGLFEVDTNTGVATLIGDNMLSENTAISSLAFVDTTTVTVPASVWLFGSGLVGLIGFSRRKGHV